MNKRVWNLFIVTSLAATLHACSKNDDDNIVPTQPASQGSTLTLNGGTGGASAVNSVFVDFSEDRQDSAKRNSWDLGFYSGDDFRVIINHSTGASAARLDKTDLAQVSYSDTIGHGAELVLGQGAGKMSAIDPVDTSKTSYLAGTVIQNISATDADNKVYLINRGTGSGYELEKVRIMRKGNGYTLQYAPINSGTYKTLDIAKNSNYNFVYASFNTDNTVQVEPAKASWDIEWTLTTYKATATIPYLFSDFVLINFVNGVQAAEVLTATVSYDNFSESHLPAVTFSSNRDAIAGKWRNTTGTVGVKTDRFYVVKDAAGNVYKLKFISFTTADGGTRGYPQITYKLVKKA